MDTDKINETMNFIMDIKYVYKEIRKADS